MKSVKEEKISADCQDFTPIAVTPACTTDSIVWDSNVIVRPFLFKEKDSDDDVMCIET
jgi:hypothetical protein